VVASLVLAVMVGLVSQSQAAPTSAPAAVPVAAPTAAPAEPTAAPAAPADVNAKLDALTRKFEAQEEELKALRAQVTSGSNLATMTDTDRQLLAQMIRDEVAKSDTLKAALPGWLDGLTFVGNIRARYEGQYYSGFDPNKVNHGANGQDNVVGKQAKNSLDFNRERIRLQFGFIKKFDDEWTGGFLLSTDDSTYSGSSNSGSKPWETNQTLTGDFSNKPIALDQAWIQYRPACLNTKVDQLTVITGKFANPFVTTEMLWDPDVRPEGVAESWVHKCTDEFSIFATLGQFFLDDSQFVNTGGASPTATPYGNTAMMAYQLGLRYKITPDVAWTLAMAYYEYHGLQYDTTVGTVANGNSYNASSAAANGVAVGAADSGMKILDVYSDLTFLVGPNKTPLKFFAQADWNVADNAPRSFTIPSGATRGTYEDPYHNQDQAYIFGVTYGQTKNKGDWAVGYNYRWVEADAVFSPFTDSAFNGSDHQGHTLFFSYALAKNVVGTVRYVHYDWIVDKVDPNRDMIRAEVQVNF
jgi:hypothetical protein